MSAWRNSFLLNFHVDSELTQHARVGVAKRVPADAFSPQA